MLDIKEIKLIKRFNCFIYENITGRYVSNSHGFCAWNEPCVTHFPLEISTVVLKALKLQLNVTKLLNNITLGIGLLSRVLNIYLRTRFEIYQ